MGEPSRDRHSGVCRPLERGDISPGWVGEAGALLTTGRDHERDQAVSAREARPLNQAEAPEGPPPPPALSPRGSPRLQLWVDEVLLVATDEATS